MRKMYSEEKLISLIEEHGAGGYTAGTGISIDEKEIAIDIKAGAGISISGDTISATGAAKPYTEDSTASGNLNLTISGGSQMVKFPSWTGGNISFTFTGEDESKVYEYDFLFPAITDSHLMINVSVPSNSIFTDFKQSANPYISYGTGHLIDGSSALLDSYCLHIHIVGNTSKGYAVTSYINCFMK